MMKARLSRVGRIAARPAGMPRLGFPRGAAGRICPGYVGGRQRAVRGTRCRLRAPHLGIRMGSGGKGITAFPCDDLDMENVFIVISLTVKCGEHDPWRGRLSIARFSLVDAEQAATHSKTAGWKGRQVGRESHSLSFY